MSSPIQCPSCFQRYPYNEALVGRQVKCKKCGGVFVVPSAAPAGLSDFLSEELDAPHPASQKPAAVVEPAPKPHRPVFEPEANRSGKKRKPKREKRPTSALTKLGGGIMGGAVGCPVGYALTSQQPIGSGMGAFCGILLVVGFVLLILGLFIR